MKSDCPKNRFRIIIEGTFNGADAERIVKLMARVAKSDIKKFMLYEDRPDYRTLRAPEIVVYKDDDWQRLAPPPLG